MAQPVDLTLEGTLLASAARSSGGISPSQVNNGSSGLVVWLNITVLAATSLQIVVKSTDPVSGTAMTIATGTAQTATGIYGLIMFPGATAAASSGAGTADIISMGLPANWLVQIVQSGPGSNTFSVGYATIP